MNHDTTICAIASPPGNGAIALIRLSGKGARKILQKVFQPAGNKVSLSSIKPNTTIFGRIIDGKAILDEVIACFYKAPRSYTGEDLVEISCHGSTFIQQSILQLLIKYGARMAGPGEFTLRAFLNGKIDLSQAEAVADVIASESGASLQLALNQMRGGFSKEIANLRAQLLKFSSLIELELDFSEEEVEFADRKKLLLLIKQIKTTFDDLAGSFRLGNVIKNGVPVAIVGKTNVGKSTLLNALLKEEKAIVSEIHGTTRDAIEDVINIGGILFRFADTAGLRKSTDKIEKIGIQRSFEKAAKASIILLLIDARERFPEIQKQVKLISPKKGQHLIILLNKSDLLKQTEINAKIKALKIPHPVLAVSAKKGIHLEQLHKLLLKSIDYTGNSKEVIVTNTRHLEALQKASGASARVIKGIEKNHAGDLVAMDIREILHYLGEISGEITTNEILGNIFKNFCIGK